ncbi:phage portal protein [Chelativorans sp. ZYF759]|uniref:phage portal protein n=1 Tax=Chelativorans sp. ZYF759 TaxID=2692213 RepID=UPI00145F77B3|nr:phage portal protein [Chelativorans sp. ZYF759]
MTIDSALGVPAVWAAANFLPGTLAGLPLHLYKRTSSGRERASGGLATVLHDAVNPGMSSFDWRIYMFGQVFTEGRGVTFIERNATGKPMNLWPLDPGGVTVKRKNGQKVYEYRDGQSRKVVYEASEVIDIPFMLKRDMLGHRSPILTNKDVVGLAQAVTRYGSKFFQNGGVPPFAITGPFQSAGALQRSADDLAAAVQKAAKENRLALSLPPGHDIKQLGVDPEKSQLVELQRFIIEQIARIYSLPPVFLQDLTHGTFSNTEQQDLHLVKHTIKRWVEQFEQELNLKLFGRNNNRQYAEMNVDGLLRGDFKARMEGYAKGIQNAILKPNEVRRRENLPDDPEGDKLLVQGATVPLGSQPNQTQPPAGDDDDA